VDGAEQRFTEFAGTWRGKYPAMTPRGKSSWPEFAPLRTTGRIIAWKSTLNRLTITYGTYGNCRNVN
jgi:hypothetical protein